MDPEVLLTDYSMVFQDVVLFDDTVMENIRLGKRGATDAEVLAAARAANCEEFVQRLPKGYDTPIGENGAKLSGGERQRISIARALLKDAPIILLDEATASLDVENETKVQEALSHLLTGKTVLVIAHRMRTVEAADHIIVLSDGQGSRRKAPGGTYESKRSLLSYGGIAAPEPWMAIKIGNSIKRTEKKCGKPHFFLSPSMLFHQQPHYLLHGLGQILPARSGCIADFLYSRFCRPASFKGTQTPLKRIDRSYNFHCCSYPFTHFAHSTHSHHVFCDNACPAIPEEPDGPPG